ncbi:SUR7/pali family protein [Ceratobasidium theobromae]|uniref:SUR7/pali family protein n=1 Tax=Ceratobasidium theobromae TaxID=1582974 RepID=A0A5N5QQB1_9AGAM|nr:SUR7/pali family protein [Ceratobasidium theobromae]
MARVFCIPGVIFLVGALALQILVSISLRYVPALDIARARFPSGTVFAGSSQAASEVRMGIWSYCYRVEQNGDFACSPAKHGYALDLRSSGGDNEHISASWTRGLVLHPISAVLILFALLLSFSEHLTVALFASLMSFLASFFVLIAFLCDIALFAYLRRRASNLDGATSSSRPGNGFWLTLASFVLLLLAGCTVCLGRRHDRRHSGGGTGLATTSDAYATNAAAGAARPWYSRFVPKK